MRRGEPEALTMHGGGHRVNHSEYFYFKNGKMHNGLVVASWALVDSLAGQGGFCCVPGSHKANYNYQQLYDPASYAEPVVHVPLKAGSLVLFTEALTHGTMPWNANHERHTLFYKYCPTAGSWETYRPEMAAEVRKRIPADWGKEKVALAETLLAPPHVHY
jgi:ectoine hydroxylase-related dioxygenase (phytanoyl-CoA dioxygenase family)